MARPNQFSRPPKGVRGIRKAKDGKKTLKRLLSCIFSDYKLHFLVVLIFILISSVAGVAGSLFTKTLLDDYITPMLSMDIPDFTPLLRAILSMALIYMSGVISIFLYNRLMVDVAQGVLKKIRDNMFTKMQTLPLRYFDSHHHGDTMSRYTNDTDTLRQMIAQSVPQAFSSVITIISVFVAMITTNLIPTLVVLVLVGIMMTISRKITGKSSKFFISQQKSLGTVNGYIE